MRRTTSQGIAGTVPPARASRMGTRLRQAAGAAALTAALAACGGSATQASGTATNIPAGTATGTATAMTPDAPTSGSSMATGSGSAPMPTRSTSSGSMSSSMSSSSMSSGSMSSSGMAGMDSDGGAPPAGIQVASHPRYPVGSQVLLGADHEMGMKGARATVVGAFTTITYAVTYTPTTGGATVHDHKWVVQQEIKDAGARRLANGTQVVLTANHMPGMNGAHATIVSSTTQTVYMVDWDMDGTTMKNHKWVVEDEMRPAS